ncbi:MAG: hypothetical protein ACK4TB_16345 [Gemmobacter sp.]
MRDQTAEETLGDARRRRAVVAAHLALGGVLLLATVLGWPQADANEPLKTLLHWPWR